MLVARETFASNLYDYVRDNYYTILNGIKNELEIPKSFTDIEFDFSFDYISCDDIVSSLPANEFDSNGRYIHIYYPSKDSLNCYLIFRFSISGLSRLYMMDVEQLMKGVVHVNKF